MQCQLIIVDQRNGSIIFLEQLILLKVIILKMTNISLPTTESILSLTGDISD